MLMLAIQLQLLLIVACVQSNGEDESVEIVYTYSLCPKTDDARERLPEQLRSFSGEQGARLIDRSDGVQQELSNMESAVLDRTGGPPILLTIEKPDEFRVSATNLGLKEKVALTIRLWKVRPDGSPVSGLIERLSRSWTIREVEGAVTDDPPC